MRESEGAILERYLSSPEQTSFALEEGLGVTLQIEFTYAYLYIGQV